MFCFFSKTSLSVKVRAISTNMYPSKPQYTFVKELFTGWCASMLLKKLCHRVFLKISLVFENINSLKLLWSTSSASPEIIHFVFFLCASAFLVEFVFGCIYDKSLPLCFGIFWSNIVSWKIWQNLWDNF